ncbi:radical SAM protein [Geomonas oryzae]|uniref:radical SAM protein n=1 Tax=Geomonas oryzae TaxID=2364273 RepID=UPI00100BE0DD|nr:radical SAM protein [Geomonas oryzae]
MTDYREYSTSKSIVGEAISPFVLAFHLTYKCPLQCEHCCFNCNMKKSQRIHEDIVKDVLLDINKVKSIKYVAFTGGEPFLYGIQPLAEMVNKAKAGGKTTRIITSGFWAGVDLYAENVLDILAKAGLDELSLSYDDYHAKYVPHHNLINIVKFSLDKGIKLFISTTTTENNIINKKFIIDILNKEIKDITGIIIEETGLAHTGRASKLQEKVCTDRYIGPCPFVLRHPTITPSLRVLPCCGTLPYHKHHEIGNLKKDSISNIIEQSYNSLFFKWLAFEGPVKLIERVNKAFDTQYTSAHSSICDACNYIYSANGVYADIQKYVSSNPQVVSIEEMVLQSLNKYSGPSEWFATL